MNNTINMEQLTTFAQTFAASFAANLVTEQEKHKLAHRNAAVSYVPTSNKPTKKVVNAINLFKNIDRKPADTLQLMVNQWKINPVGVPAIIEDYYFRADLVQDITNFLLSPVDYGFWMIGLHGTGKTSIAEQVAARFGIQCFSETCSERTEFLDLFGYSVPCSGGNMKYIKGGLYNALEQGGICILNEVDAMSPSELIKLNELLSGKPMFIAQTESWLYPSKDFRLMITSNTNGCGDDGRYVGTNQLNAAFKDRFMKVYIDYLPEDIEVALLKSFFDTKIDKTNPKFTTVNEKQYLALIKMMVKVANGLRKAANTMGGDMTPPSIRALKRWLQLIIDGSRTEGMTGTKAAFMKAYGYDLSEAEQMAAIEVCTEHFGSF